MFDPLNKVTFETFGTTIERRFFWIVKSAIVEYFGHVTDELGQLGVQLVGDFLFNFLQIC